MKPGYYSIGVIAEMLGIHPQTIRYYEKEGLITPSRTPGKTRLYSDEDVELLKMIHSLAHDRGVNVAGIHLILQMKKSYEFELNRIESEHKEMIEYLMRMVKNRLDDLGETNPASPVPVFRRIPVRYSRS